MLRAILDASPLMSFFALDKLSELLQFYDVLLIPRAVEQEFLNKAPCGTVDERHEWIQQQYSNSPLQINACLEYGSDLIQLYHSQPSIDLGEAEVLAQNQYLDNLCELILDDQKVVKFARNQGFKVKGTIALLAELELRFQRCDFFQAIKLLKEGPRKFHICEDLAQKIYQATKARLG